jgi:hypothetical protein
MTVKKMENETKAEKKSKNVETKIWLRGEESSRCLSNKEEAIERLAAIEFGAGREEGP